MQYKLQFRDLDAKQGAPGEHWTDWETRPGTQAQMQALKDSAEICAVRDGNAWVFRIVTDTQSERPVA